MIPSGFEYHRPSDLPAAVKILDEHGDEARVLAGGHSIIPMMKLRMADLSHLIDLQDVASLKEVSVSGDTITIGAMVTQAELIGNDALAKAAPILREAALQIADPQVRYVGTIGGNVANGDPGNDMPGLMQCLDATYVLYGSDGEREVDAREFYEAAYMTARADNEILTHIKIKATTAGYAYEKQKRKIGDYATAAAAVLIEQSGGKVTSASIAMTNLSDTPIHSVGAGDALVGTACDAAAINAAIAAMQVDIQPNEDNRGPIEFKRHVAATMLRRAIERAWSRA
ncbi:FAD binding domain-containing protein [Marivivens aquimaris]|uniref:FAD binding domain-containing protein n=1 Tax=Marivivens aquimaris TaxID=2774876 RepID=UPI00187E6551|nr:xanthine dehydrogenase family protein subunit M [Marivivens aquimaris]